jgi:hypothetical protein
VIIGSIGLVLVAAALLVVGLFLGSDPLFYGSIMSSAVAALALVVGVRQFPAGRLPDADFDHAPVRLGALPALAYAPPRPIGRATVPGLSVPEQTSGSLIDEVVDADPWLDQADSSVPSDEPPGQVLSAEDAERLEQLSTEVIVVDGRPRFHLAECMHLLGRSRECEPLPVYEALELGFTPCGQCEPVDVLLAETPAP